MVAQDAAINAAKLDIDSLFRVVNEDESHTLKSTKVYFDSEQQTLDLLFNSMTTKLEGTQESLSSALTQISAVNGEITTLVQSAEAMGTELAATKTQAQQTADQFKWLVKSGSGETDFILTDRVASLLSQEFNIDALTTFKNSAESGTQTVIDGGAIKAKSVKANSVDVDDVFAQDITATGSISGATLHGAKEIGIGNYRFVSLENGALVLRYVK